MQEFQTDLWVKPNPRTIEFSDKKRQALFKPFQFMDQVKLDSIGHAFQQDVLNAVSEAAAQSNTDQLEFDGDFDSENQEFVRRMRAFVSRLSEWSARDQIYRQSKVDTLKIDLLYVSDLQNLFCEYLQHYVTILRRQTHQGELTEKDGGVDGPYSHDKVKLVICALRQIVNSATNTAFFGMIQIILKTTSNLNNFKRLSLEFQRECLSINEDLTVLVELLFQKMCAQKRVFQMLFSSQEKWDKNFKQVATDFQDYCNGIIRDFASITQLMLFKAGQGAQEHIKLLREQEGCELESRLAKIKQSCHLLVSDSIEDTRECFSLHAFTLSLLMGQYFDLVKQQKQMFEKHIDPTKVVQNLILIISSKDPYFTSRVRVSALKVLQFLCELDTHPEFRYNNIRDNPYFNIVVLYFQDYVSMTKNFAEVLSHDSTDQSQMQIDSGNGEGQEERSVFGSQLFLRAFLSFLYIMIGLKTRNMHTQLFPQLVEPIIRLITVMPRDHTYIINLDCQKSALQILKEIIKNGVSFDDPRQLVLLIDRLKVELCILREDYSAQVGKVEWMPSRTDDSDVNSNSMAKRQDLIGSCLRFLCVSIVKMDPNQISITQNFVTHSRKILESRIFEEYLKDLVFDSNQSDTAPESKQEQVIDPIYMCCVQLYTYVFNDLHQKIGEYIENGLLPCILNSLSRRIPKQQDVLVVTCKFMRLLCLNSEGHRILVESKLLKKLLDLALDHKTQTEFVSLQQNRDQLNLLSQLASESQDLSDQMMEANVANLKAVIDLSWKLTEDYLESERLNKEPNQSPQILEQRKDLYYKSQNEFEKVVENVCYALLFMVHEQLDVISHVNQDALTNIQRSILKQEDLHQVLKKVITTPTIASAASNFLMIFGDLVTVIFMLSGKDSFEAYVNWLASLLIGQITSLKTLLGVENLNDFDPADFKKLQSREMPSIVESDPDKLDLIFNRYIMSAEDLLWVTVAKIHAYLDLLLITETISRSAGRDELHKVCIDFFLKPEICRCEHNLRIDIIQLEELLKKFKYTKFVEKFQKKVVSKGELIARYSDRIAQVDWKEYTTILEPHNDYEEALNLYFTFEYARVSSFKIEEQTDIKNKFRVMLNPGDDDVPEASLCKKKCVQFSNRISSIYRREKQFTLGSANSELNCYCKNNSQTYMQIIKGLAQRCQQHLAQVSDTSNARGDVVEGVDLELIRIKLHMQPIMQDLSQLLVSGNKISRSACMAFFLTNLFEIGFVEQVFIIIDWACKVMLAYDNPANPCSKLLLHQQVLHECLLAPMNLLSALISGDFLKRGDLKYYLEPNELSANIAIAKLKLAMMKNLFQPMVVFFIEKEATQFLLIADKYDKDFSVLLEGIYCILSANAFFGTGSAFDPEMLKIIKTQYTNAHTKQPVSGQSRATDPSISQLVEMGFQEPDVLEALEKTGRDFERALEYLFSLNDRRVASELVQPKPEETKQGQSQTIDTTKDLKKSKALANIITESQTEFQPTSDHQMQIGDASEVEAANELEFSQRRKEVIEIVAKQIVRVLPTHLINSPIAKRETIFMTFLFQIKKEEDAKVKAALIEATHGIIRNLIETIAISDQDPAQGNNGVDWLLIDCIKWCMSTEEITLPVEFQLSSLGDILANQLMKKITQLGCYFKYEKPDDKELSPEEKKVVQIKHHEVTSTIQNIIFNVSHYVKVISNICDEIKNGQSLSCLMWMMTDAEKSSQPIDLKDLYRIIDELKLQYTNSDANYFSEEKISSMQIDTVDTSAKTKSILALDQEKAGQHLQAYFGCIFLFFKELNQVSGFFHESFGGTLNPIITKAIRCLNMMAQIGQVGSFDFAKTFLQKNFLRVMLQAKVLDKEFKIETDVWRPPMKLENSPFQHLEQVGKLQHHAALGMFRSLVRELSNPKKDLVKRLELNLKRQLYKQFLQNFKRGEQTDFFDYLQSLQPQTRRKDDSPQIVPLPDQADQKSKTKTKDQLLARDPALNRSLRPRTKSQEKGSQQVQQGSKNRATIQPEQQQTLPNKLLKKLLVKFDDYNQSKLDDFIAFNKVALNDQFNVHNQSFLQVCSRICIIKEVEVVPNDKGAQTTQISATKIEVYNKSGERTTIQDVNDILSRAYGVVKGIYPGKDAELIAEFKDGDSQRKALKAKSITMTLRGNIHELSFKEVIEQSEEKKESKKPDQPKKELYIMLKRQILKDIIFDPDFNQSLHFQTFGQSSNREQINSSNQTSQIQKDLAHQLLEMVVEQTRGIKMDILKILRNPNAFLQADREQPVFVSNDTVLKIVFPEESKGLMIDLSEEQKQNQLPRFIVDSKESTSISKQYFIDYSGILNALVEILEKHPAIAETILKHNDYKTLKFLFRNIFFLMSAHVDGRKDNQVVFKNMQSYNSQKLSDRLTIVISFLKQLTTISKSTSLKQQQTVHEIQKILVGLMAKSLITQSRPQVQMQLKSGQQEEACAQLVESARLVAQYNTVWLLTQFLFYKPPQVPVLKPVDAIVNNAIKLEEQVKLHVVKLLLLETQLMQQKNGGLTSSNQNASSLAFLSHIKKLLDSLEESKFLFIKAKVPCMHMCIWAVTSILKVFENTPELFVQIHGGAPPPYSDSDSDQNDESVSRTEEVKGNLEMMSIDGAHPSSQTLNQQRMGLVSDDEDDEDEEDEEGEEDMSESDSYGSADFMEGNEDLSSNRDNQSFADADMLEVALNNHEEESDDFDEDSYGSLSDYDDEDSSALLEILPQIAVQNTASIKGPSSFNNDNQDNDIIELIYTGNNNSAGQPDANALAQIPENPHGQPEDESYYSAEEQDSYEPPGTYDQEENDSVLSFESNQEREPFGEPHENGGHDYYDEIEGIDGTVNSYSDDESDDLHRHHNHFHHEHNRPQLINPAGLSHLPVQMQLWHQMNVNLVETDPLETKMISKINALHAVLESVASSHWPYQVYISGIQQRVSPENTAPNQGQHSEPSSTVLIDEQGDEIVRINPDQFKDKDPVDNRPKPANRHQIQSQLHRSALDIEGMDPLFLESLGPQGLQNIADSHQIQNTVVNSANQVSRDSMNLQQAQSRYNTIISTIREHPQGIQGELITQVQRTINQRQLPQQISTQNLDQIINAITQAVGIDSSAQPQANARNTNLADEPQPDPRARFISVDTIAVDLLGPNDQSRQTHSPKNMKPAPEQHRQEREHDKTKIQIRGSQYMQNSFQDISDLIQKFQKNTVVSTTDKQCTDLIKQHLLPLESETTEVKFGKTHDCMQMALIGFKIFEKNDIQIQSRIRLLFLIPSLRITLIFRVLKLISTEVRSLVDHRDNCLKKNEFSPYKSKESMPFIDKEGQMLLTEMPLDQMIMVTLSIIEQLQECLQILGLQKAAKQQSIELSKVIASDDLLVKYATLSGLDPSLLNQSIIESVIGSLQLYFTTVKSDPWILTLDKSQATAKTTLVNAVLGSLRKILQPLSKISELQMPVEKICELIVAPSYLKLTKLGHQHTRKILNDISETENVKLIGKYLEDRLENAMKSIIELLTKKKVALVDQGVQDVNLSTHEKFIQLLDETKELLKLSSGVSKIKTENICRQETLAQLFSISNSILQKEQMKAESESQGTAQKHATDTNASSYAFMYRNDIKEMILILFALCEYNLRLVFSQPKPIKISTAEATTTLTQSPPNKDEDESKVSVQIQTNQLRRTQSSAADQEMVEEDNQTEIFKVLESQIAALWQANGEAGENVGSVQKFQLDRRLRSIIGFFISNKKLINVFIRVNQQVINIQLKNLVVKIPQILEFDTKRLIWRIMLKKTKQKIRGGSWEMSVRRDQAFEDSFAIMRQAKPDEWKMPMRITFQDEAGIDEGGLTKEWFSLLSRHMFNEDMALFLKSSTGSTYFPNPKSIVQADHLELFDFIGKFVGKALLEQQLLDCYFVKAFYKLILEMPLTHEDLEDYDQDLYKSLTWILQNSGAEHLCTYFVETQDYFGESKDTPLCEGGAERLVTDDNKEEYVKLVANYRLKQAIKPQMEAFMGGLFSAVPKDLIKIFDNRELELLISGLQVVDIDDLRENTTYQGYNANSKPILLFWEALREFDNSERAEFIQFVTGSSKVPVEGFKGLRGQSGIQKFTIAMVHSADQNRLPQSHTCINQLDLPQYRDKETMKRMLLTACSEGKTFAMA